jgi:hypothetical protein
MECADCALKCSCAYFAVVSSVTEYYPQNDGDQNEDGEMMAAHWLALSTQAGMKASTATVTMRPENARPRNPDRSGDAGTAESNMRAPASDRQRGSTPREVD